MRIGKEKKQEQEEEGAWDFVHSIIMEGIRARATDIHFEPDGLYPTKWITVRFRIDGILHDAKKIESFPSGLESLVNSIKVCSKMDPSQKRKGQDGRFGFKIGERELDIRATSLPTMSGEKIVLRIIDSQRYVMNLEDLGMTKEALARYKSFIPKPHGFILITGPIGCGKTTTLYSTLDKIKTREKSICTIEDPIESKLNGISQTQVNVEFGVSFSSALRILLRQDSQIIMIGEIRDVDTMRVSLQSSLAGCLVFSTFHAKDSTHTIIRLMDMGLEPYLLSETLTCIVNQRLVRLICTACKGKGCPTCKQSGFHKRVGIFEVMDISDTIRSLILQKASAKVLSDAAVKEGMITLKQLGERLVAQGLTTSAEIYRVLAFEE